jgi:hypothetical protein
MTEDYTKQLTDIITNIPWLMQAFREVRSLDLPDWYIGAGAIRNTVWNVLHTLPTESNQNDIDVVYFDPLNLKPETDEKYTNRLRQLDGTREWEVVNQARAYMFDTAQANNIPQATSACHGISTWTETATCIGVRLEKDDLFAFCAPYGLDDLMEMIIRPTPPPYENLEVFERRMIQKRWQEIWPKLKHKKN